MGQRRQRAVLAVAFLAPAFLIYTTFVIYPMVRTFYTSLFEWRGVSARMTYVGLGNFTRAFQDANFINAVGNTATFFVGLVPALLGLSLLFALLLARGGRLSQFHRVVYFFPNVIPLVAVAAIWAALYDPISGLINATLQKLGLFSLAKTWLGDPSTALPALMAVEVWRQVGFYMVLFIAGIQNIPPSVIEAARIDGASDFKVSTRIILPLLNPILKVGVVFVIINALNVFVTPQLMTRGGPSRHTQTIGLYIHEQAFQNSNFGYASALGALFFLLIFVITVVALRWMRGEDVEY